MLEVERALSEWSEITPALVVNRLSAMAANNSKPYQLREIQAFGFRVPETLVTTDPEAALAFWERHGAVVYKSVSGVRSRVARLRLEHASRLLRVRWCPTQFQQYIVGRDYRVHVVGDEVLASEVRSEADDYRYAAGGGVNVLACRVPPGVADRCKALAASMRLLVAGIDLRRGADGEWYCFEVNPSPAFTFYEGTTGAPIAAAIARLLTAAPLDRA